MGKIYGTFNLTGSDSLASYNGAALSQGDAAIVFTQNSTLIYFLDITSGALESIPDVISPTTSADDKRWLLVFKSDDSGTPLRIPKTSSFTGVVRESYIVDTTSNIIELTLPSTANNGESIKVVDGKDFSSNILTVLRNGNTIGDKDEDMIVDTKGLSFELVYYDGDWKIA